MSSKANSFNRTLDDLQNIRILVVWSQIASCHYYNFFVEFHKNNLADFGICFYGDFGICFFIFHFEVLWFSQNLTF